MEDNAAAYGGVRRSRPKTDLDDLAVLGGEPAFMEPLHIGRPNIGDRARFLRRVEDLLDRRWLTNDGPYVREFEEALAARLGVRHCLAMCNGTVALEIAIRALGLRGEVITPAFTFVATAHALKWQEITPVFADVGRSSHTLDPNRVVEMITPATSGILGVHLWGRACDVDGLVNVADAHGLTLLFDAAHALETTHCGVTVGNFGAAEVFSFHATKFVNSFEGGAVATNDDELADRIKLMRNFGFSGYDNVIYVGTNGKMSEVAAAMGLTSLERIDHLVEINRRNHDLYRRGLEGIPGLTMLPYPSGERSNFQYVVTEVDEAEAGVSRERLMEVLWAENVLTRRYFYPGVHRMEPYRSYFPHAGLLLPVTNQLVTRVMTLPTGESVGADDIGAICDIIRIAVSCAGDLEKRMGRPPRDLSGLTLADLGE